MESGLRNVDWDTVRAFLAATRSRSFRKAAESLGVTPATVSKMIARLEDVTGYPLFYRESEGLRLSPEGRRVLQAAEEVERSITDMLRVAAAANSTMAGPIRLAVTEGLGTFWLMPLLTDYVQERAGKVRVELQAAMKSVDVLRFEADISIQFQQPTNPDLVQRRLGYLYLTPFASKEYVTERGLLTRLEDLVDHLVVEQETDQLNSYTLDEVFGAGSRDRMVRIKTNFSSAHYWAVANGAGIGLLPNYARLIGADLIYMPAGFHHKVPIYMATHPEIAKSARHRHFIDWLTGCFAAERYPWFGDKFIEPNELETMAEYRPVGGYLPGLRRRSA